jgi:hypothetical protein
MKQEDSLQNKFTYKELRQIWKPLTKYCIHNYTSTLTTDKRAILDIKKRWIHFYSLEDFTLEETIQEIEDYTEDKLELQSIKGH